MDGTDAFDGRVALVTGSSSGIGAAIATAFAQRGATVVVNSVSSVAAGEQLAADLAKASYIQADVSDPDEAARLVETTVGRHGRLDIVVNNAGTTQVIAHHDLDAATDDAVRQMAPLRRSGTPDDVASACVGLVDARYATGQVLLVDGGMALR